MNPSGDSSNSAQGRARVPGSPGGYDPEVAPPPRASGSASVGRASVSGRASVGDTGRAAVGSASVGRASVGIPMDPRQDILTGPGGPGSSLPRERRSRRGARGRKHRRRTIILAAIAVFIMLSGGAVVGTGYYFDSVQLPADLPLPQSTTITYADGTTPMAKIGDTNRTIIAKDQIGDNVKHAVVATEDSTFYSNNGVDFKGIVRAVWNNVTGGNTQGASTITQQYVRKAFDLKGVTYARKIREAVMAMKIDQTYQKDDILSFYLNIVYFGNGAYGIEAAAQTYFGKSAKDLTVAEAMVLAAVIKDPEGQQGFNPTINLDGAKARWNNYVKLQMVKLGYLSQADADKLVYPTNIRKPTAMGAGAAQYGQDGPTAFVVHHVMGELVNDTGRFTAQDLKQGGYKIVTTIDKPKEDALIKFADRTQPGSVMASQPARLAPAVVSIDPHNGRVVAYYGGPNGTGLDEAGIYRDPVLLNNNDWTGLHYSPGSTFKMYTLATALSQGYGIDSYWFGPDSRRFEGRGLENGKPTTKTSPITNSEKGEACAACTLQVALQQSLNTVYYAVGLAVGPANVINMAHQMGIEHLWDDNGKRYDLADKGDGQTTFTPNQLYPQHIAPEVSIGQFGVTVEDNASALATIANRGVHFEPHFVMSVSKGDQVEYREVTKNTDVTKTTKLTKEELADEEWAMSTVLDNLNGKNKLAGNRPAGAKTGTWEVCAGTGDCPKAFVNQTRDAWYAGFTPDLATVVHIGSGDPNNPVAAYIPAGSKKETTMYGINLPGDLWKAYMNAALANTPKTALPADKEHVPGTKDGEAPTPNQGNNDGGNNDGGNGGNQGGGNQGGGNQGGGNQGGGNQGGGGNGFPGQVSTGPSRPPIHF